MKPLEFKIKTYPLASRESKVSKDDLASPFAGGGSLSGFYDALPKILAAPDLRELARRILAAREAGKTVILGMGAHVIKVGLSPLIIDLMERGLINAVAMNGAGIVHDFEMGLQGATSEDVSATLDEGTFGMAEETGRYLNEATLAAYRNDQGLGESVGKMLLEMDAPHKDVSILAAGTRLDLPATIHVAVGTDILHIHPQADGAAIGAATHYDFRRFCAVALGINEGGVYLNFGSAVILPEVFLKALTVARNTGHPLGNFTTANFDFIRHYRPLTNVVQRPTQSSGKGFNFVGHHEIMFPLLYGLLGELGEKK